MLRVCSFALWFKFLIVVVPIFLVLSVPGLSLLVKHELQGEHDGLGARIGGASARAATFLHRYGGLENGNFARDVLSSLTVA